MMLWFRIGVLVFLVKDGSDRLVMVVGYYSSWNISGGLLIFWVNCVMIVEMLLFVELLVMVIWFGLLFSLVVFLLI